MTLDTLTVESQLQRAHERHTYLEQLGTAKHQQIVQLNTQLAQANVELERLRGAIEFSSIVVADLKKDLEALKTLTAAAEMAAQMAATSAAQATPAASPPQPTT